MQQTESGTPRACGRRPADYLQPTARAADCVATLIRRLPAQLPTRRARPIAPRRAGVPLRRRAPATRGAVLTRPLRASAPRPAVVAAVLAPSRAHEAQAENSGVAGTFTARILREFGDVESAHHATPGHGRAATSLPNRRAESV